ncbi:MAG: TolC family protein [Bacteroidetes bacterium]|nr:TolC family protein [Bacteroidota bacterium]
MEAKITILLKWGALGLVIGCYLITSNGYTQSSNQIGGLEALLNFAQQHSSVRLTNEKQQELARLTTKTALGNSFNPRIPTIASMINNTKQSVSFIPADLFGGPSGTYREVTMGQQYVSNMSFSPQFEILNLGNYARIQSAKMNEKIVATNAELAEKNLLEQVGAIYFNIVGFYAQIEILEKNKTIADSILKLVEERYQQGVARVQDRNEAKVNSIAIEDKIAQLKIAVRQQYVVLQVLCDTNEPIEITARLNHSANFSPKEMLVASSDLLNRAVLFQREFLKYELKSAKWQQLPTLSLMTSFAWQNNSNIRFFDPKTNWVQSSYWGLRFSWDLPTNVTKLATYKTGQLNLQLAEINQQHQLLQTNSVNQQLEMDYQKALSQLQHATSIMLLKNENFEKSMNQFKADILALDKLLLVCNDLIMSESTRMSALNLVMFSQAKIEINNRY